MQKSWGYLKEDGTFDGLVGELQRKQVDYGSSPLFVRVDRGTVIEYGRKTWSLGSAFIFRQPKIKGSADVFLKPLSTSIWILTLVAAALMIIALKLSHTGEKMSKHLGKSMENSWSLFVINAVAAFCQQGLTAVPYFLAGRIIILNLFVFSLIIYQFYSASLVSHLLIQPRSDIKTVSDILQSNMKVGCEDILYNKDYFIYTTDKSHKHMYKKLMRTTNNSFLEPAEGIRLVNKGGYAFHVELVTGYPIIQKTFSNRHICELNQVPLFGNRPMHTNLQKHSPFRDIVHRLAEHGILHREILFWHPKKPECNQAEKMFNVIGFDYFCPALFVLGCGMLISLGKCPYGTRRGLPGGDRRKKMSFVHLSIDLPSSIIFKSKVMCVRQEFLLICLAINYKKNA
ncbi:unnamed protein product [Callosobruchus maculatus]|uniref:Ionotropic glutamate receptor C-terminal domain-containing protein n=1 Tax=Callosobruchus maculatus TaxID=64391 RepID=A0A653CU10_CALMS|nr:unnamed protein product [Callosobruchus maculatus]